MTILTTFLILVSTYRGLSTVRICGAFTITSTTSTHRQPCRALFPPLAPSSPSSLNAATENYDDSCDVLVLGSGPAGCAIAALLGAKGDLDVVVANKDFEKEWVPNYGVWKDEWQNIIDRYRSLGLELDGGKVGRSIDAEWSVTDCYFGGSFDIPTEQRLRIDRPYCRVDRFALKRSLNKNFRVIKASHVSEAIGINMYSPAGTLVHDKEGTTILLQPKDISAPCVTIRAKIVVDTTGHETKLVLRDTREPYTHPGFQIAYGALVEVDESSAADKSKVGPYHKEAMTLFDYRTDHFEGDDVEMIKATKSPTFMYAMPLDGNQIFFEETSLVARPAMSFQECKDRCFRRLKHLGIQVTKVKEEEFCYIPMGGALPARDQRILGFGGAAAMVHPSTGYHICRALIGASDAAVAIQEELAKESPNMDRAVASAYNALWSPSNIRQRNFATFGGEFLMKQEVVGLRGFFDGFFRLPLELWGGFLAGWPGLAYNENHETWLRRMWFGLNFIIKLPPQVGLAMFTSIVSYSLFENLSLIQSVTPFLGEPDSYEYNRNLDRIGDIVTKQEAVRMIQQSEAFAEMSTEVAATTETISGTVLRTTSPVTIVVETVKTEELATVSTRSQATATEEGEVVSMEN
jgi:lycopene beta-cyclase